MLRIIECKAEGRIRPVDPPYPGVHGEGKKRFLADLFVGCCNNIGTDFRSRAA